MTHHKNAGKPGASRADSHANWELHPFHFAFRASQGARSGLVAGLWACSGAAWPAPRPVGGRWREPAGAGASDG
jgi:hypothetical protein